MSWLPIIVVLALVLLLVFSGCTGLQKLGNQSQQVSIPDRSRSENQFLDCPSAPNCVNSLSSMTDETHYTPPFRYDSLFPDAKRILLEIIEEYPRTRVTLVQERYIHAEFRSAFFGFVDDVEFLFPEDHPIVHVRSASRVGQGDLGANRKRVDELRKMFEDRLAVLR
jgi:uncharacterized protein (DUF1499 family)